MLLHCYIIFASAALSWTAKSGKLSIKKVGEFLLTNEVYINASLSLDRSDRLLLNTWMTEFQVKQVNITSHYRLDMTRHLEHNFGSKNTNPKWIDCMSIHEREINKCKSSYVTSERECLNTANSVDTAEVNAVHQLEKEIRKWRKSYRYLSSMCTNSNPDDKDAASYCLVDHVTRDNYNAVFQRLIILKLDAMEKVLVRLNRTSADLETCLRISLSEFLNTVRRVMDTLHTCYSRINKT